MARNVTNGIGRIGSKTGGGGGSGKIVTTNPFTRSTGITTDGNNNIIKVTLGEHVYSSIQYNAVGLVTGYNENMLVYAGWNVMARSIELIAGRTWYSGTIGKRKHGNYQKNRSAFLLEYSILL